MPVENNNYLKELKELSEPVSAFVQEQGTFDILNNYSSFTKLQRVTVWCLHFIRNARCPHHKINGCLSSPELSVALTIGFVKKSTIFCKKLKLRNSTFHN